MSGNGDSETLLNENVRKAQAEWLKIDAERLTHFIASQPEVAGRVSDVVVEYPSSGQGISNGIAFVSADIDAGQGARHRDLVVRYSPGRTLLKQKSFHDEFLTVRAVLAADVPAPDVLWLDAQGDRLGVKGYIMERVSGDIPSAGMFSQGLLAEATPERRKEIMLEAAGFHGRLRRAAMGERTVCRICSSAARVRTHFERELRWWLYEANCNLAPGHEKLARIHSAFDWLLAHQPPSRTPTLVHGDAQLCNLIFRNDRVIAAIDRELAFLGHGETDLAIIIWMTTTSAALRSRGRWRSERCGIHRAFRAGKRCADRELELSAHVRALQTGQCADRFRRDDAGLRCVLGVQLVRTRRNVDTLPRRRAIALRALADRACF